MKYFFGLSVEAEIKTRYRELVKRHHPDVGGCVSIMKDINKQYLEVMNGAYQKQGKSISEIDELLKNDKLASEALSKIIGIACLEIELCGSWIWITGDTKPAKTILKEAKFYWANKKKAWYWRPPEQKGKTFRGGKLSLGEIREKYGTQAIGSKRKAISP